MFGKRLPAQRRRGEERSVANIWDLMDDMWRTPFSFEEPGIVPALEVKENDDKIEVKAELPGIEPKEVDIHLERGYLTIKGEKKQEKKEEKDNYVHMETSYGSFSRTIPLPSEVAPDKVKAKYKKGILTITLPKSEKTKPKKVEIAAS